MRNSQEYIQYEKDEMYHIPFEKKVIWLEMKGLVLQAFLLYIYHHLYMDVGKKLGEEILNMLILLYLRILRK